jgi:hypothetical protein
MATLFPLSVKNDRPLPSDYSGPAFVWDIDKTYLSTRFSSMKGLARIPVEFAIDKRAIPGMPEVLRAIRRGPHHKVECQPLYFISASPPFLRSVLENKMLLDGVEQDGIIFKDWVGTLLQLKPGRLWEQLGFKLTALLVGRQDRIHAREYLFGDDTELDAMAFYLYGQVLKKKLSGGQLEEIMKEEGVGDRDRAGIHHLLHHLPPDRGGVEKIFIHLENKTSPDEYKKFGKDLIPVKGGFQLALALYQLDLIDELGVRDAKNAVAGAPRYRHGSVEELLNDALARHLIQKSKIKIF